MADPTYSAALTKGITVHIPGEKLKSVTKSNAKSPRKQVKEGSVNIKMCYEQYENISKYMKDKIKEIERNAYQETFSSLVKFVKDSHSSGPAGITEIPAAILVMGVNMPDHSNIFCLLEERLNAEGVFATVKLQSRECSSFPHLIHKLVSRVITKYQEKMNTDDDDGEPLLKKGSCTLSKLFTFYNNLPVVSAISNLPQIRQSPRKTPTKTKNVSAPPQQSLKSKPIVVLIQDVEAFNIEVLKELVLNCSLYANKLPLVLVFGMASAMVTLHNILPQKTLSCLGIETFYSLTAIEYLTKILQQVVLSPDNPFKLGSRAFRLIVDTVLYHDFSVTNLTNMLEFCLIEHFYENDVAVLCCPETEISQKLQLLSSEQLEDIKKLPSFSKFIENNPDSVKTKSKHLKALFEDLLQKQHSHYRNVIILLHCLHVLTKNLPGYPLGKHLRELYPLIFEENMTLSIPFQQAFQLLKLTSKDELETKIERCLDVLKAADESDEVTLIKKSFLHHLKTIRSLTDSDFEEQQTTFDGFSSEKVMSRAQLQEKLRHQLKSKRSKFENNREKTIEFILSLFEKLQSPFSLPLHEILYFDDALSMKQHLMATPRITLHRDLVDPSYRLKCSCCKINDSHEISASMPDVCTLYKLHLEGGKLINLYDCLQAFKSVKQEDMDADEDETELNIRFMHSVAELQHLGFIKSTKRKTDHVARLTFSSF